MRRWSLSDLALARPVTVGMTLVAVILLGLIGFARMPLAFLPTKQASGAYVRVFITRTSPEVLEREVIRPIEEAVAGLRSLSRIQVGSGAWGVRVNLDFEPGTDADVRKLELRDRIERVRGSLPDFVQNIEIGSYGQEDDPVLEAHVASDVDLSQDYYLIEEHIVRALERIDGVARVQLDGVSPHELEVAVNLEAARRAGVSLSDLAMTVKSARQGHGYGLVRDARAEAGVRSPSQLATADRFGRLPLRRGASAAVAPLGQEAGATESQSSEQSLAGALETGSFARIEEIASLGIHPEENRNGKRLNGRQAVDLEVYASAGASVVDVCGRVHAAIAAMKEDPALSGIDVLVVHDQGAIILKTLGDLRDTGIYGGILAMAVLFLFLHRVGTTIAAAICIPVSVLAAGAILFMRGEELNCIVLLGLVLGVGMLIDNAVVIVEAIATHVRGGKSPIEAARAGAREVGFATMASTLSTVIVFIPLMINEPSDQMTAYLRPLGTTFAIALIASLFVSQTAVALLMGRLIPVRLDAPTRHPVLDRVVAAYERIIFAVLRFPKTALVLGLSMAGSAMWPVSHLQLKLGRMEKQPDHLPIRLEFSGSRNMDKTGSHIVAIEQALLPRRFELGVESLSCSYSDHHGDCRVYPSRAFESQSELEAFVATIGKALPEQIGVRYRLNETDMHWRGTTDRHEVEFVLRGEDMATLMALSARVAQHLAQELPKGDPSDPASEGYDVITTPFSDGARELLISLDDEKLHRLGLDAERVAQQIATAFQGVPLGKVQGERGELALRLTSIGSSSQPTGIDDVRNFPVGVDTGRQVPLAAVADLQLRRQPWWIQRVDRQTEISLRVRFFQPDAQANFATLSRAMETFVFPPGYSWGRGTAWRAEAESGMEMLVNLALCLLLVYAVMASLFESFWQPLGILVTCLLGAFGAPWALWATETTVDSTAIVGGFILVGVVVNNGIMLIDRAISLRVQGVPRQRAVAQACRDRMRPILMTVTTTILGLVPMLIHHPTLAGIYYHAVAIVVAAGLATSTVVTLVFLPAAYLAIEDATVWVQDTWRRFHHGQGARV